jgi:hypothetical protein
MRLSANYRGQGPRFAKTLAPLPATLSPPPLPASLFPSIPALVGGEQRRRGPECSATESAAGGAVICRRRRPGRFRRILGKGGVVFSGKGCVCVGKFERGQGVRDEGGGGFRRGRGREGTRGWLDATSQPLSVVHSPKHPSDASECAESTGVFLLHVVGRRRGGGSNHFPPPRLPPRRRNKGGEIR